MSIENAETGKPWSPTEVGAIVSVYFQMLRMQEMGQIPNKTEHNRRLLQLLPARNLASIEYKHRNISAVLNLLGIQSLNGYKPLLNFQRMLIEVVSSAVSRDRILDEVSLRSVETPAEQPLIEDFSDFVVQVPTLRQRVADTSPLFERLPVKRDYLKREARNRSLGLAGELLVIDFEQRRLHAAGAKKLAERIEHTSDLKGDGAGFDILSFDEDGRERFIEVKTTAYVAETPFFITPNEVSFSQEQDQQFHLYRLFSFRKKPQMFSVVGRVDANFRLDAASYRATLLTTK
jgi:hypothetical protein